MEKIDAKVVETGVTAMIERLRAEKKDFAQEAVRWAEEAGRLRALLHDAQRDGERYRWLRECDIAGEDMVMVRGEKGRHTDELLSGHQLDAAIDAAMAAEREGQG